MDVAIDICALEDEIEVSNPRDTTIRLTCAGLLQFFGDDEDPA